MNAEREIAAACAALRGQTLATRHSLEAGQHRSGSRTPSQNQAGEPKRFVPPLDRPHSNVRPGSARPGISSVRRPGFEAAAALGSNPILWGGAVLMIAAAMFRAASYVGFGGPVVVHLVWPV